jgi:hypothetical protein
MTTKQATKVFLAGLMNTIRRRMDIFAQASEARRRMSAA